MKKTTFLILFSALNLFVIAQQPEWTIGTLPTPENNSYFYQNGKGYGESYEGARINALSQAIVNGALSIGINLTVSEIRGLIIKGDLTQINIPVFPVCEYETSHDDRTLVYVLIQMAKAGNTKSEFTQYDCSKSKMVGKRDKKKFEKQAFTRFENNIQMGLLIQHFQSEDFKENNYDSYGINLRYANYEYSSLGGGVEVFTSSTTELKRWDFGISGLVNYGDEIFTGEIGFGIGYNFDFGIHYDVPISFHYRNFFIQYKACFYNTPKSPLNKNEKAINQYDDMSYAEALECFENNGFAKNIGGIKEDYSTDSGWSPMYKASISHIISMGFRIARW